MLRLQSIQVERLRSSRVIPARRGSESEFSTITFSEKALLRALEKKSVPRYRGMAQPERIGMSFSLVKPGH